MNPQNVKPRDVIMEDAQGNPIEGPILGSVVVVAPNEGAGTSKLDDIYDSVNVDEGKPIAVDGPKEFPVLDQRSAQIVDGS